MVYQLRDIVKDVRTALESNRHEGELLREEDTDTLTLDDLIISKVVEGARAVEAVAPVMSLEGGHSFGDALYWEEGGCGWTLLPDDFLRLIAFKMDCWRRAVHEPITPSDPRYAMQRSEFRGIRGNCSRPVCAIVPRPEGMSLEFFSCPDTGASVERAVYLPNPKIDPFGGVDLCQRCHGAIVAKIAALTAGALMETERAAELEKQAETMLR